jgi:hypothetical protein
MLGHQIDATRELIPLVGLQIAPPQRLQYQRPIPRVASLKLLANGRLSQRSVKIRSDSLEIDDLSSTILPVLTPLARLQTQIDTYDYDHYL